MSASRNPDNTQIPRLMIPHPCSNEILNPLHPSSCGNIPFEYITRKLQDWGMIYLYNTATADVFVRAVSVPREECRGKRNVENLRVELERTTLSTIRNVKLQVRIVPLQQPPPLDPPAVPPIARQPIVIEKAFPINLSLLSAVPDQPQQAQQHSLPTYPPPTNHPPPQAPIPALPMRKFPPQTP